MKLYTYDPAPNPARLKMFIEYKGIDIETQQIKLMELEQQSDEYLAIVPEATVPALVLGDGTRLTEVIAIAHYLESLYPESPLLGIEPLEKAMILNWSHRLFNSVFLPCAEVYRNINPAFKDRALSGLKPYAQIPALAERGRTRLMHSFKCFNDELAQRQFIAGDDASFADIDLLAFLAFAKRVVKVEPDTTLMYLAAWKERAQLAFGIG